jgi:uroporphyrin-III C-methyltransferase/precorrin-2 dehydrogenase/sirohydrochlorin ferrochelatase
VVFYMGLGALPTIARRLIEHGRGADTPAAVVERATTDRQRVVTGTLAALPDLAKRYAFKPPALVIVGEVVTLRERLRWFDRPDERVMDEAGVHAPSEEIETWRKM